MTDQELDFVFDLMGSKLRSGSGTNKSTHCPLAPWTHTKGRDRSPSLTARAGQPSLYRCWSCRNEGTVRKLARTYGDHSGDYRAYDYVSQIEGDQGGTTWKKIEKPYGAYSRKFGRKIAEKAMVIDEDTLKKFLEEIPKYAFERGLTQEQVIRWEIGYDPLEKRMIFPVRSIKGQLIGVSGRDLTGLVKNKYKHYPGLSRDSVFYGERFLDHSCRRVILVEGFFDVLALERRGLKNVLGTMGTSLSMQHFEKLKNWADEVLFFVDGDKPGLRFAQEQGQRIFITLSKRVGIAGVKFNPEFIPKSVMSPRWVESDYRFLFADGFEGRDPDSWTTADVDAALSSVGEFVIGKGGVEVGIRAWSR
jgi:hypothetical protein